MMHILGKNNYHAELKSIEGFWCFLVSRPFFCSSFISALNRQAPSSIPASQWAQSVWCGEKQKGAKDFFFFLKSNFKSGDILSKDSRCNALTVLTASSLSETHQRESVVHISPPEWRLCTARERKLSRHHKHILSAGHVNCHGDAVCSMGKREAGCSLCNLFIVCQFISHRSMPQTNFLLLPQSTFLLVKKTSPLH